LLPDVTFEINGHEYKHEQAYFASDIEFNKAWQFHKRQARMDGVEAPKPRRQDPSRDFVNVWQEIGQSRVYVPQKQDVGRILKLECTPISQNGSTPYTSHPTPYTHYTLHPTPYTPNPKPQNPTPKT